MTNMDIWVANQNAAMYSENENEYMTDVMYDMFEEDNKET